MSRIDVLYHGLAEDIIAHGYAYKTDNRPQPCLQLSSYEMRIPLDEFPLLTTKKMFTKGIVEELLWFLRGEDNIKPLLDAGVTIWNQDAYNFYKRIFNSIESNPEIMYSQEEFINHIKLGNIHIQGMNGYVLGDVGRNYGVQWRSWQGEKPLSIDMDALPKYDSEQMKALIKSVHSQPLFYVNLDSEVVKIEFDQITNLLGNLMKPNPISRRHIVTAWNPAETDDTALPPCHWAFEIIPEPVEAGYGFHLKWHQRSVDTFLGLPFNIASYALLAEIIGSLTGLVPLGIIGDLSNVHFYHPHIEIVEEQLDRSVAEFEASTLSFSDNYLSWADSFKQGGCTFDEFLNNITHSDFIFNNYQSYPALKGDMFAPTE